MVKNFEGKRSWETHLYSYATEMVEVNFACLDFGFGVYVHCNHSISFIFFFFYFGVHLQLSKHIHNTTGQLSKIKGRVPDLGSKTETPRGKNLKQRLWQAGNILRPSWRPPETSSSYFFCHRFQLCLVCSLLFYFISSYLSNIFLWIKKAIVNYSALLLMNSNLLLKQVKCHITEQ